MLADDAAHCTAAGAPKRHAPLIAFFIGLVQDTIPVTLVGMLDLLSTVRAAMHDPNWQGIAEPVASDVGGRTQRTAAF